MRPYTNHRARRGFFFLFAIIAIVAVGFLIMFLWNWLMPTLFKLSSISYWQALGLFVLSRILFGSFHFSKPMNRNNKTEFDRETFKERFMQMSHEERQAFREQWKQRCSK